jgi:hypothetical protein
MRTIQKAGAFALIFTTKCVRNALSTLADIQDGSPTEKTPDTELRQLRAQVQQLNESLEEIKESLRPIEPWSNLTIQ